jgi:restriction system protein
MARDEIPSVKAFLAPIVQALKEAGGTASVEQLQEYSVRALNISTELQTVAHDPKRGARTEVSYRMAWARTQLKQRGLIEPVGKRQWALTERGRTAVV